MAATAIHPTALVYPGAELGTGVEIGPFCVVEAGAELGDDCRLRPHVHVLGRSYIGARTHLASGSVIGGEPQDGRFQGEHSVVRVGANCHFHEHVTVHRPSVKEMDPRGHSTETVIGRGVTLMAGSHVGHNSVIEDEAVLVNNCAIGGHAHVGAKAFLSAGSAVHQFGKVGRLTLVGGACMLTKDAPPFSIVVGSYPPIWRGPNVVGLKRAGLDSAERSALRKALYQTLKEAPNPQQAARELRNSEYATVAELAHFILQSKRGLCTAPTKGLPLEAQREK